MDSVTKGQNSCNHSGDDSGKDTEREAGKGERKILMPTKCYHGK